MKNIIMLCLLLSTSVYAQKVAITGSVINSDLINSSLNQIGSIQQSILSVEKFQGLNGNCWVLMTGQSIAGSDLAIYEPSFAVLPDARGRFLRTFGTETVAVGAVQDDSLQGHNHVIRGGGGSIQSMGAVDQVMGASSYQVADVSTIGGMINDGTNGAPRAANETRPKNLVVNTYIKINKSCGF